MEEFLGHEEIATKTIGMSRAPLTRYISRSEVKIPPRKTPTQTVGL